jgi:hypothetical protein
MTDVDRVERSAEYSESQSRTRRSNKVSPTLFYQPSERLNDADENDVGVKKSPPGDRRALRVLSSMRHGG